MPTQVGWQLSQTTMNPIIKVTSVHRLTHTSIAHTAAYFVCILVGSTCEPILDEKVSE